jgi:hypothetical protein
MADANNEDLQHLADGDEGIRLKTVPLSSWQNEAGYKYDRVLRELD